MDRLEAMRGCYDLKPVPPSINTSLLTGSSASCGGSIRFTQPGAFNDPFELLPELIAPAVEHPQRLTISFDIMAMRRDPPVGEIPSSDEVDSSDVISRDIVKELNRTIGIFCLSQINNSLLMWSHYADQYVGAVIEFDGSKDFFAGQIEVEYRSLRPRKNISAYLVANQPVPVAELCAKSDQWAYEQEVRIVRSLSDCRRTTALDSRGFPIFVQDIPIDCIKSVTLGERTKVSDQRAAFALVKETHVGLALAAVDHQGYAFRREIVKFPGPLSAPMISPRTAHIFSHLNNGFGEIARNLIEKHPMSKIVNNTV
jgi:hypothetical protein